MVRGSGGSTRPGRARPASRSWPGAAALFVTLLGAQAARAQGTQPAPQTQGTTAAVGVRLDRIVVRWFAPETGGVAKPQFIFERELAFEARIEALADRGAGGLAAPRAGEPATSAEPQAQRHVRAALDRHIAETLLANLPIDPQPLPADIAKRAESARAVLEQRVQGRTRLIAAAAAEGMSSDELDRILRRQARASLYVDKMIAPMLDPSDPELREVFRSGVTPYEGQPFEQVSPLLRRWYVGLKLSQALETYYQNARSRVRITILRSR